MESSAESARPQQQRCDFATTHWSMVVRAGGRNDGAGEQALAELCQRYWYPLYAYVRRRVAHVDDAQDLTQEFFGRLLEKNTLARATPSRGKFRAFLLTSMKHFLSNEWDRAGAHKRGGDRRQLSFDVAEGESRMKFEPLDEQTPERTFERQWVLTLLDLVMNRLQAEFAAQGKIRQFELLSGTLTGGRDSQPYTDICEDLGISEDAARQAAHRLRKRYRELLREEVAHTVSDPAEVEGEIRSLFEALGD